MNSFLHTKGASRNRKSKDRQYNGQKKKKKNKRKTYTKTTKDRATLNHITNRG